MRHCQYVKKQPKRATFVKAVTVQPCFRTKVKHSQALRTGYEDAQLGDYEVKKCLLKVAVC